MYQSLTQWIKKSFSQDDPVTERNEISEAEIEQIMAICRVRNPAKALTSSHRDDDHFEVDSDTGKVTLTMRDLTGTGTDFGSDYIYWFHPDHFDVLVDDVVIEEHNYMYYPVSCDLTFYDAVDTDATVDIRGHILDARKLMDAVAAQWLLKLSMVGDVTGVVFDRIAKRFNMVKKQLYGVRTIRRY